MPEFYFSKFSKINYANTICLDLTKRARLIHQKNVDPAQYYPIEIDDQLRADQLADKAYSDPYSDWLIYLNNNMLDPYYDYHMSDEDFQAYLIDNYGSYPISTQTVVYWRTAWPSEITRMTPAAYAALPPGWFKYYIPVYANNYSARVSNGVSYYQQAFLDWRVNTNQIVSFSIGNMFGANSFAVGNVVNVVVAGNPVGNATIIEANSSFVYAQHTTGITANSFVLHSHLRDAFNANVTATILSQNVVSQNIPSNEMIFWEAVTAFDQAEERNTLNKYLSLTNPNVRYQISSIMTSLLKG